jgi:hypothetical protein
MFEHLSLLVGVKRIAALKRDEKTGVACDTSPSRERSKKSRREVPALLPDMNIHCIHHYVTLSYSFLLSPISMV